ncbi:response regulator [Lentibacter sp. XHP0401]|jgi:CheY-like chemotaxis protein|uniref:response regulator n=1 Tax=Lentibacter sp. XHP0401 TaxID=2984334 RepID=UPI0021E6EC9E|nr:response regulator [Lentibacter sp. XHP0401]MCV2894237.1 response regulator [Lentibacter sp. XHP0401]
MHILAVDDDPIILEILSAFVETMDDHEIVTAESVADALNIIEHQEKHFDCFLLDIQMPGTDGIEFCGILREMNAYLRTPIIMLTAMSEKSYIDKAFNAGATDYITKPFELNGLKGRLSLVEKIAIEARNTSSKLTNASPLRRNRDLVQQELNLHSPIPIFDVDGVIENHAMENYVTKLSRSELCGSVVIGFTIRHAADLFCNLSDFDFSCVITDVSEAISDCLLPAQRLVSYAGNGTYVAVVEGVTHIDLERLVNQMNRCIHAMELCTSDGMSLDVRICAGRPNRLVWRKGTAAVEALREAHISAEDAAEQLERELSCIWSTEMTA